MNSYFVRREHRDRPVSDQMCPYINTPTGCTNLKCPYNHPKGFVHACIFGVYCKKRASGECHFLHPDERGFVVLQTHQHNHRYKPVQRKSIPCHKAPPPPTPSQDVPPASTQEEHPEKDEYGHPFVCDEKGDIIGIMDEGRFISFIMDIPIEVQEAYSAYEAEMNDYDPEYPNDDDDEWETDPRAYGFPDD